jgi:hypothetical protein
MSNGKGRTTYSNGAGRRRANGSGRRNPNGRGKRLF